MVVEVEPIEIDVRKAVVDFVELETETVVESILGVLLDLELEVEITSGRELVVDTLLVDDIFVVVLDLIEESVDPNPDGELEAKLPVALLNREVEDTVSQRVSAAKLSPSHLRFSG